MSILDYFRNLLGAKRQEEPGVNDGAGISYPRKEKFRNPIWQNDEDDDDIDDFRHFGAGTHFNILTDPQEITHFFEAEMNKIFGQFDSIFGHEFFPVYSEKHTRILPLENSKDNLRDKMLKKTSEPESSVEETFSDNIVNLNKIVIKDDLSKAWNNNDVTLKTSQSVTPHSFSFGKTIRKEFIRRPDGILEQKQTIMDSEGNKETIISREVGDKKYIVTTKIDKDGVETKSEDLINIDEKDLQDFNQKWIHPQKDKPDNGHDPTLNRFPWNKFFGPDPKL